MDATNQLLHSTRARMAYIGSVVTWARGLSCVTYDVVELSSTTDVRDKDNWTPLHTACVGGRKDVVQYLVEELKMDVGECF